MDSSPIIISILHIDLISPLNHDASLPFHLINSILSLLISISSHYLLLYDILLFHSNMIQIYALAPYSIIIYALISYPLSVLIWIDSMDSNHEMMFFDHSIMIYQPIYHFDFDKNSLINLLIQIIFFLQYYIIITFFTR